jgi:hypothetical protein
VDIFKSLLLAGFLVWTEGSFGHSQKVVATVKVIRDKLQGRNLDLFEGLEQKLTTYLNGYNWGKTDDDTPLPVNFQIVPDQVTSDGGKVVSGSIYVLNDKELQFLDNSCAFVLTKGSAYYHDENRIEPFLSIIDFYMYIIIGDDRDTLGKLFGTPFFQKARNIATQAKSIVTYNASGWEDRLLKADQFLDQRYMDYRIMKDFYYEGLSNFENGDMNAARKNVTKAIDMIEPLLSRTYTSYHAERFLQVHYNEICKVFQDTKDKKIFDRLMKLDPKNKETYQRYKDGK